MAIEYSLVQEFEKASLCDASEDSRDIAFVHKHRALQQQNRYLVAAVLLLSLLSFGLLALAVTNSASESRCTAKIQGWSPLLSAVEYQDVNFENEFLHQTKYRGPPTNYLEREWERLWDHDMISVSLDDYHHFNKSADRRWIEAPGGLAANLDVFHQLHCLNLVRQYTWKEYYDEHPDLVQKPTDMQRASEKGLRYHVDHCIETLRLSLMCHGDVTPYLFVKHSEDDKMGTADFNMKHKCRNFDKIVDVFTQRTVQARWPDSPFETTQYEQIPGIPE